MSMYTWELSSNHSGKTSKVNIKNSYLLELAAHINISTRIVVNSCYVMPKARKVAVILISITNSNIWIRLTLLVAEMCEAELEPWHYHTKMDQEGEDIKSTFQPISPPEITSELTVGQIETTIKVDEQEKVEQVPLSKFGPYCDT